MAESMYVDLLDDNTRFFSEILYFETNDTTKIRIVVWLLYEMVILTTGNLAKCYWRGIRRFAFVTRSKQFNAVSCPLACLVWQIVHVTFNLPPPTNITNMFGN
jgi:hypothetical protein